MLVEVDIAGLVVLMLQKVTLGTVGKIKLLRRRTRKDGRERSQDHLSGVGGVCVIPCADKWNSQGRDYSKIR